MSEKIRAWLRGTWIHHLYRFIVVKGKGHRPVLPLRELVRVPFIYDRLSYLMQVCRLGRLRRLKQGIPPGEGGDSDHMQKVYDHNANVTAGKLILTNRVCERHYAVAALPVRSLKNEMLLSVGSRTVHELLAAWCQGFSWANVTGVDLYSTHPKILRMNMQQMDLEDAVFDCVVMSNVLAYASDTSRALGECARVLKPGGRFVFNITFEPESEKWPESGQDSKAIRVMLQECGLEIYFWDTCQSVNSLGHDQAWHLVGVYKPEEAGSGIDPVSL